MKSMFLVAAAVCCCTQGAIAGSLGEHPAVLVKRNAGIETIQSQTLKFYRHPAGPQWLAHAPADAGNDEVADKPTDLAATQHLKAGVAY